MKYYFINTDRATVKRAIERAGKENFYEAIQEGDFDYRKGLENYRLRSEEDSLYVFIQIGYPSGWYDLLKINSAHAGNDFWIKKKISTKCVITYHNND